MRYICFYVIGLRLVNKKFIVFPDIFLTCNRNLFVLVSVFAKLLMPVCGVRKFVSVLYSVFVREWNLSVVMSGLSHWKYDFRHVHCSAVQSWAVPLYRLWVIGRQVWTAAMPVRRVRWLSSGAINLFSGYLRWGCRIKFYFSCLSLSVFRTIDYTCVFAESVRI
jgi:hypothetical protein